MAASGTAAHHCASGAEESAGGLIPQAVIASIAAYSGKLPCVTLTYAQSLDGSLAACRGEMVALSGSESMQMTHQLRAVHDSILVGIGTVVADNPRLTTRGISGASDPTPVILDPKLRIPLDCKLVHAAGAGRRILVLATEDTVDTPDGAARRAALESRGVTVCPCPATVTHTQSTRMSVRHILEVLAGCAVRSMMVEGGASVIEAFLDEGAATATADGKEHNPALVQNVIITVCPVFVGGVRAAVGGGSAPQDTQGCKGTGGNKGRAIPRHHFPSLGAPPGSQGPGPVYQQLGSDIVVHGSLVAPSRP